MSTVTAPQRAGHAGHRRFPRLPGRNALAKPVVTAIHDGTLAEPLKTDYTTTGADAVPGLVRRSGPTMDVLERVANGLRNLDSPVAYLRSVHAARPVLGDTLYGEARFLGTAPDGGVLYAGIQLGSTAEGDWLLDEFDPERLGQLIREFRKARRALRPGLFRRLLDVLPGGARGGE